MRGGSPTTSPREFSTGTFARSPASNPSRARNAASALRSGRYAPSSTLSAIPRPDRPAQRAPPHAPFATQPSPSRMSSRSAAPSPRMSSGRAPHRSAARVAASRASRAARTQTPSARVSARGSQRRSRRSPPASEFGSRSAAVAICSPHELLARMRLEPVARDRPATLATEEQHRRVLARAVVFEACRLRAALEVVLCRVRPWRAGSARGSSCSGRWR